MKINLIDGRDRTATAVPHGFGPATRMFLADVYIGKKAHYEFVLLANSSRDARARLKKNAQTVIKALTSNQDVNGKWNYRTLEEKTQKMRGVLAAIKNNKIKFTELTSCRVYPVSYFDDTRLVC